MDQWICWDLITKWHDNMEGAGCRMVATLRCCNHRCCNHGHIYPVAMCGRLMYVCTVLYRTCSGRTCCTRQKSLCAEPCFGVLCALGCSGSFTLGHVLYPPNLLEYENKQYVLHCRSLVRDVTVHQSHFWPRHVLYCKYWTTRGWGQHMICYHTQQMQTLDHSGLGSTHDLLSYPTNANIGPLGVWVNT
jgi:hypothetical protein